jgi:FkbM family methyltransferase
MGIKYLIGAAAGTVLETILRSRAFPLTRYFPRGVVWMYDAQRFIGTRKFNVIFDVGANIGQTAEGLLRFFPTAKIYCFEPVSSSFGILNARFGKRVNCLQLALGGEAAEKEIKLRDDPEMNSFLSTYQRPGHYTGDSEFVSVSTVDQICLEHGITAIDVLKMDVQGWELEVLRGASTMLGSNRVRFIFTEVGFRRNDAEMVMFGDLDAAISQLGFLFCGFYDLFRYGRAKEFTLFGNALYLNPNFQP